MKRKRIDLLRESVCYANQAIQEKGLVVASFGNVSGIDRESGTVAIKPSGVPYEKLTAADVVLVDLECTVVAGDLNPSSDTETHVALYKAFPKIGGIVHTHAKFSTAWAQAGRSLLCFGTTHADYFHGPVPCTEMIEDRQIAGNYEKETAVQIIDAFRSIDYQAVPGVLVAAHGPFTWGETPEEAVFHSYLLEYIAELGMLSLSVAGNTGLQGIKRSLLDKHYLRKHGENAYYGQKKNE